MDQDRRPDHRPHLPLLLTHLRTGTLASRQRRGGQMGLLDRLRGGRGWSASARAAAPGGSVSLLDGQDDLEVVGELAYQDVLWRLCGGTVGDRIRCDIVAVLVPEPMNPYDANAIAVQIGGRTVGYLSRATAQEYLPGLK